MRSGFVIGRKTLKVMTVVYLKPRAASDAYGQIAGPFTLKAVVTK